MKQLLALKVNDHPGVLHRITGLFLRRGFNIATITVGACEEPGVSRMTILLEVADERVMDQVRKQLAKQVDVLEVEDLTDRDAVTRELCLVRVEAPLKMRSDLHSLIQPFRAQLIDVGFETVVVEVTGSPAKIDALLDLLRPFGVLEIVRTGLAALPRERQTGNGGTARREARSVEV
ncbi:MAG: Acetolactate synthase small subunit [Brockia lithotrophica]|uniref:Acetolactate synthase small subunit n=1 Tax=Brockia lithotrophica TaxID=933949 RepID=A0A2T5G4I8_9BACL|nr:acetolactate synthase small subunit [Brockia lithotrophica]MBT9253332.1 acetolactate synthase small subunit [Brockia lithotrophica]PTQ51083.1 MAG: Acetolactate synthase small subunit [Brockia lithotrophica]